MRFRRRVPDAKPKPLPSRSSHYALIVHGSQTGSSLRHSRLYLCSTDEHACSHAHYTVACTGFVGEGGAVRYFCSRDCPDAA